MRSVAAVLALLVLAAYGGSLRNEFVFDDLIFVRKDVRVKSVAQAPRFFTEPLWSLGQEPVRAGSHAYYRPLQLLPLGISHALAGDAAWPCHLLSLTMHWLNALSVFAIFRALVGGSGPALLAAALFAVHPAYSESVFWVSDVAGLGVALATLLLFRTYLSPLGGSWRGRAAMGFLFLVALWFKETGITAPLLLVLYELVIGRRGRRLGLAAVGLVPAFAVYLFFRWRAMGGLSLGLQGMKLTPIELVINAIALVPHYVATFLWPFRLNFYHVFTPIGGVSSPLFAAGLALLAGAVVACFVTLRRHPCVTFGIGWALVTVAPYLLPRWPDLNVYAERYLYLPSVGIFLVVAYAAEKKGTFLFSQPKIGMSPFFARRVAALAVGAVVLVFVVADALRAIDWRDDVTLYSRTLARSPDAKLILDNLGVKLYELGRYDEGIPLLERLIALDANFPEARENLALLYLARGRLSEAATTLEEAAKAEPGKPTVFLNLGYVYERQGRRDDSVAAYLHATRLNPREAMAWQNLAVIAYETGQFGNARQAVRRVLAVEPENAAALKLAATLEGRSERRRPKGEPEAPETVRRCQSARHILDQGQRQEAILALEAAAWLDEASPLPHQYLANVFAMHGNLMLALRHQRAALDRDPENPLYSRNLQSLRQTLARRGKRKVELPEAKP